MCISVPSRVKKITKRTIVVESSKGITRVARNSKCRCRVGDMVIIDKNKIIRKMF